MKYFWVIVFGIPFYSTVCESVNHELCHYFRTLAIHQCILFWCLCLCRIWLASVQILSGNSICLKMSCKNRLKSDTITLILAVRSKIPTWFDYQRNVHLGILGRGWKYSFASWPKIWTGKISFSYFAKWFLRHFSYL